MKINYFDYYLPEHLIAQSPLEKRDNSRLLVVDKANQTISHNHFYDIVDLLDTNSLLVLNDTKVLPSRIYGEKIDTNAKIELLLLRELSKDLWEVLAKPFRRLRVGTVIKFGDLLEAKVINILEDGIVHVVFKYEGILIQKLQQLGEMPLPPYIHEKLLDSDRYQTVYASNLGSAAAPTAGLHFTEELLEKIKAKGIAIITLTLHVGLGTFRPVMVEDIAEHNMHFEHYIINEQTANTLNEAKANGKKIISVGTTSTRTLEAVYQKYDKFVATSGETNIFIYPGYKFKAIDGLITNFHLPKSTLIMLVSAFATRDLIMESYQEAIKNEYRFFSFGDAMYIK